MGISKKKITIFKCDCFVLDVRYNESIYSSDKDAGCCWRETASSSFDLKENLAEEK